LNQLLHPSPLYMFSTDFPTVSVSLNYSLVPPGFNL
jgi:hypothetical protein